MAPLAEDSGASSKESRRIASPWKEGVGIEGKHFLKGKAQLRDHPSNLYSFLCWHSFPIAKKYIYIGPRFISDINPLTATELHWGLIWLIRSNLILAAIQKCKQQKWFF